jgi:predicted transcriptional regulator
MSTNNHQQYSNQQIGVLERIRALADENRLLLLSWLHQGEMNVGTLATRLNLSEPTVSHHLTKLREAGFVTLRADGTQRIYSINASGMTALKRALDQLPALVQEQPKSDDSWIDALPAEFSADERKQLRDMTHNGRLKQLPNLRTRRQKAYLVLRWLASRFEPDVRYSEKQVNAVLKSVHDDFASLRRYLIEFGYLRRERDGGAYWLAPADDAPDAEAN